MGMIFCRGCGNQLHETAPKCTHCGATQDKAASKTEDIPEGIKGWSWGAFLLNWIWAIGNKTWIGLLAIIPWVGFIMAIVLGFKGREWAWKNKEWESIEHFNNVQKKWSYWGVVLFISLASIGLAVGIGHEIYEYYSKRQASVSEGTIRVSEAQESSGDSGPASASAANYSLEYKKLVVTDTSIGDIFHLQQRGDLDGIAINHPSRRGIVNLMESVVDDANLTGYVHIEAAYQFGDKYLISVSTGEGGRSCPATTYAFTYDAILEHVTGKAEVDGCSENMIIHAEKNKLILKKEGAQSIFYDGQVTSRKAPGTEAKAAGEIVSVPLPRGGCDMEYGDLLRQVGLSVREIEVHGPDDKDFAGYGCPYRINPAPGTRISRGTTVIYRSAWEGS